MASGLHGHEVEVTEDDLQQVEVVADPEDTAYWRRGHDIRKY